jgi:3-deoxy-7-phosphoheptulonate synthase
MEMLIILKENITKAHVDQLCQDLAKLGVNPQAIAGEGSTIIVLLGDTSQLEPERLGLLPGVERVIQVRERYKLADRRSHPQDTLVELGDVVIGGSQLVIGAGPCSVESKEQLNTTAQGVKAAGARLLRGGAFKPRTSPYSFQGLERDGLRYLKEVAAENGLPVISEITDITYLDDFLVCVDVIQVGARSMQNFELLKELGKTDKPILLKRGFANTLAELLMSAEYILKGGNSQVILCERGIRTFETATRNTLDISAIPVLKRLTHLPVFVDPSHAGGSAWLVEPLSLAAVAAGADGLLIEVHHNPPAALSDGAQSLTPAQFADLFAKLRAVAAAVGRSL